MGIPTGEPPRFRWLPRLLMTSLVLNGVVLGRPSGQPPVCGRSCCSVLPSCEYAKIVTCNCPEMDKMTLRYGDIPDTAQDVTISNTPELVIERDAIEKLPSLVNLTVSDVDQLQIRRGGMTSNAQISLRSVLFQNVSSLLTESHSFSGTWQGATTIVMQHIKDLHVMPDAFSYQAVVTGPSVILQDVQRLNLESNGFSAPMFRMSLTNVTMEECQKESFGGSTYVTEWNKITITDMNPQCFHSPRHDASLHLKSVKSETLHREAITGNINSFSAENCNFGTIQESSISLTVARFEMTKSDIAELQSESLKVHASLSFELSETTVGHLMKNALLEATKARDQNGHWPSLKLIKVNVSEAERGSLMLPDCNDLEITELNVAAPLHPVCPTDRWTRSLSTGGPEGRLTQAQNQLYFQLRKKHLCPEDDLKEFPDSAERPSCQKHVLDKTGAIEDTDADSPKAENGEEMSAKNKDPKDYDDAKAVIGVKGDGGSQHRNTVSAKDLNQHEVENFEPEEQTNGNATTSPTSGVALPEDSESDKSERSGSTMLTGGTLWLIVMSLVHILFS